MAWPRRWPCGLRCSATGPTVGLHGVACLSLWASAAAPPRAALGERHLSSRRRRPAGGTRGQADVSVAAPWLEQQARGVGAPKAAPPWRAGPSGKDAGRGCPHPRLPREPLSSERPSYLCPPQCFPYPAPPCLMPPLHWQGGPTQVGRGSRGPRGTAGGGGLSADGPRCRQPGEPTAYSLLGVALRPPQARISES